MWTVLFLSKRVSVCQITYNLDVSIVYGHTRTRRLNSFFTDKRILSEQKKVCQVLLSVFIKKSSRYLPKYDAQISYIKYLLSTWYYSGNFKNISIYNTQNSFDDQLIINSYVLSWNSFGTLIYNNKFIFDTNYLLIIIMEISTDKELFLFLCNVYLNGIIALSFWCIKSNYFLKYQHIVGNNKNYNNCNIEWLN